MLVDPNEVVWHQSQAEMAVNKILISNRFSTSSFSLHILGFVFLERSAALTVDHFNQNGNIKSISHIDAEVNADNENDGNGQKASIVDTSVNEKVLLDKSDIEMVAQSESKDLKEKSDSGGSDGGGGGGDGADSSGGRFYLFRYPKDKRIWQQLLWIIIWPVELVFVLTIPNCEQKRFKKLFPLTFLMCIVWIGSLSYLVAWMITIVGKCWMVVNWLIKKKKVSHIDCV